MFPEAIEAALKGEDFSRTSTLIKRFVVPNSFRNGQHLLASWQKRLPDDVLQAQPELSFLSARALIVTTDRRSSATWTRAGQLLQWAAQGFESKEQWEQRGEALLLSVHLAFLQQDLRRVRKLCHQAQPLLTERSPMYPHSIIYRGVDALFLGEMQVAWQYLLDGYKWLKHLDDHTGAFSTSLYLSAVCLEKGDLHLAWHYYHQALSHLDEDQNPLWQQVFLETGGREPFFASWASHWLAQLAYERNALVEARQSLSQAWALPKKPEERIHVLASGSLIQARLLHASGETEKAQDLLSAWERHARFPWPLRAIRACRARLHLAAGNLSAVEQWALATQQADPAHAPDLEAELPLLLEQEEALLLVRFHLAQTRGETALQELAPWKEKAQAQGRQRSMLEILILEALAHGACQEHRQARFSLLQALQLAQPQQFQRLFLDEGSVMEALFRTLLPELREASLLSFARLLLRGFAQGTGVQPRQQEVSREDTLLLEPLSEQEQRVLRLLAAGRSNPEIASSLVISLNTVKTHVQSLYLKLNVHNRVEASEIARRLSLL